MAKVKNQSKDIQNASIAQAEAAADQFDENGPGVQEIGDFIVVDPATPEGEAKAAELDATGTVTVDFGNGNVLTGCLVLGGAHYGVNGAEVNVQVPTDSGYVALGPIPERFVK